MIPRAILVLSLALTWWVFAGCGRDPSRPPGSVDADAAPVGDAVDAPSPWMVDADGEDTAPGDAAGAWVPWDWMGVVGTGQSLALGQYGEPARSTTQPYHNLKLATGDLAWPANPDDPRFSLVPLVEPIGRLAPTFPSAWPENVLGETMHSSMGNALTALALGAFPREIVTVHGEYGEDAQCLDVLAKDATPNGVNGHGFAASLVGTQAIARLAAAAGKTFGVGAITVVHGECDATNPRYEDDLVRLWGDYDTALRAITGQARRVPMLLSQQNSFANRASSTLAQWRVGLDHPDDITCVGPLYPYPTAEGFHLVTDGYRQLGEKFAQVAFARVVRGEPWQPLQALGASRVGRVVRVRFHVPVPPLTWDTVMPSPHPSTAAWSMGKGFEVRAGDEALTIVGVDLDGDSVVITLASDAPPGGVTVSYALFGEPSPRSVPTQGTFRWGLLRDSDPFVGSNTGLPHPNFCLAFELDVP